MKMMLAIRNGLWNAGATVIGIMTGIVGALLIPKSITPQEYGQFGYYLWLSGILGIFGTLAFPNALTKIKSELIGSGEEGYKQAQALSQGVSLLILGINFLFSIGIFLWAIQTPEPDRTFLIIVALFIVPKAMAAIMRSSLMGSQRYKPVSFVTTLGSTIQLAIIVGVFFGKWGAPGYVFAMLFASGTQVIGLFIALKDELLLFWKESGPFFQRITNAISKDTLHKYGKFLIPSALVVICTQIVWERSEIFFLKWFHADETQIGYYNLAYTITYTLFLLAGSLLSAFLPAFSHDQGSKNQQARQEKLYMGVILAALYATPISFGGLATIAPLIRILFEAYQPAIPVAQVLFIGFLPAIIGIVPGIMLQGTSQQSIWRLVVLGVIMSIVNISLDILLIPTLSSFGGAIANTCSQIVFVILVIVVVHRVFAITLPWRTIGSITGIGAITTWLIPTLILRWQPGTWGLVGAIALGGCLYLMTVWVMGYHNVLFEKQTRETKNQELETV